MNTKLKLSILFSLLSLFNNASAFNITTVLNQYPDFSTFNSLLTQTDLATEINSRNTITILAVENSILSPLSGRQLSVLKNILSVHVILDYYDVQKLQKLANKTAILTTLFQATGFARGQQGFLNVTDLSTTSVAFGSAIPGSTLGSNLVKSIASQPYNLSVLHVSNVIIPQGIDGSATFPPPPPPPPKAPSASPRVSPTPSLSPRMAPPPPSVPAQSPTEADTPVSSPVAYAPTADAPGADAPVADYSPVYDSGMALQIDLSVVYTALLTTLYLAPRN